MSETKKPNRLVEFLKSRWYGEDYPGVTPRFQVSLFAKDFGIFIGLPFLAVILFKSCESALGDSKSPRPRERIRANRDSLGVDSPRSQIISFTSDGRGSNKATVLFAAAGSLVRVRLLNVVETYSNAPVFAQVIDAGMGPKYVGATLIGEGSADSSFGRITVQFNLLRDPKRKGPSVAIAARALSLNGTLGVEAQKKEGFFARGVLNASSGTSGLAQGQGDSSDMRSQFLRALALGMLQEFDSESQVQRNRAQVLSLKPSTEFFAELTDNFPRNSR